MAKIVKTPTGEFSSYYGCYIILMAAAVFGGIIAWSAYAFYKQDQEIGKITVDEPVTFAAITLPPEVEKGLREKLSAFGTAAKDGKEARLDLTLDEINAIIQIAPDSGYGSYKDMVRVKSVNVEKNTLIADICLPLRKAKFWENKLRYLVAEGTYLISAATDGVDAKLVDISIPGKVAPSGFVDNLQVWTWIAPYRKQEPLGAMLKGVKSAKVTAAGLELGTR